MSDNLERNVQQLEESMRLFWQALTHVRDRLSTGLGLTRTQIEILFLVAKGKSQTIGELAANLSLTQGAITQTIDTLVRRDLVVRSHNDHDRRVVQVSLSPAGRVITDRIFNGRHNFLCTIVADMSEDEVKAIITGISSLAKALEKHCKNQVNEG